MRVDRARRLLPLGVAVTGVVAAHAADYALAIPDPARRSHELAATGHGYWPVALAAAFLAAAAAVAFAARKGLRVARSAPVLPAAWRLAGGQVLLFIVVETVERLGVGVDPRPFLHSPQFALGIALQIAVALVAVLVLRGVEGGARSVAAVRRWARLRRPAPLLTWTVPSDEVVVRWWGTAGDARGPPAPALT